MTDNDNARQQAKLLAHARNYGMGAKTAQVFSEYAKVDPRVLDSLPNVLQGTLTGRFSGAGPNFQNFPRETRTPISIEVERLAASMPTAKLSRVFQKKSWARIRVEHKTRSLYIPEDVAVIVLDLMRLYTQIRSRYENRERRREILREWRKQNGRRK